MFFDHFNCYFQASKSHDVGVGVDLPILTESTDIKVDDSLTLPGSNVHQIEELQQRNEGAAQGGENCVLKVMDSKKGLL